MPCCPSTIFSGNSATTAVQYTAGMLAQYGAQPRLEVLYRNEEGNYVGAGVFTLVQFDGSTIFIDHGGVARWLLKIS